MRPRIGFAALDVFATEPLPQQSPLWGHPRVLASPHTAALSRQEGTRIARLFARARQVAPTVIFIDELDSLVPARGNGLGEPQVTERVVNTILAEMDGLEELQSVVVIGAARSPA